MNSADFLHADSDTIILGETANLTLYLLLWSNATCLIIKSWNAVFRLVPSFIEAVWANNEVLFKDSTRISITEITIKGRALRL